MLSLDHVRSSSLSIIALLCLFAPSHLLHSAWQQHPVIKNKTENTTKQVTQAISTYALAENEMQCVCW